MMFKPVVAIAFSVVASMAACDYGSEGVKHSADGAADLDQWSLEPSPWLVIDVVGAEPLHRVHDVALQNDQVIVANGGSHEIAVFDTTGTMTRKFGREGRGPGEFIEVSYVLPLGSDSLLVFDMALRRFQVFDSAGDVARTFTLDTHQSRRPRGTNSPLAVTESRELIVQNMQTSIDESEPARSGVSRNTFTVTRYDLTGQLLDTLRVVPGWEAYDLYEGSPSITNVPLPFGNSTYIAANPNRVAFAATDGNTVDVLNSTGEFLFTIRDAAPPGAELEQKEIDAFRRNAVEKAPQTMKAQLQRLYDQAPFPHRRPPFRQLNITSDGALWLLTSASSDSVLHYRISDNAGRWVAELRVPSEFRIEEVSNDVIVGVWTDSLGVPEVRGYRIHARN